MRALDLKFSLFIIQSDNNMCPANRLRLLFLCILYSIYPMNNSFAQSVKIHQDTQRKTIVFGNGKMAFTLDYDQKLNISSLAINGDEVISGNGGIYSKIRTKDATYSTLHLLTNPVVKVTNNTVSISEIKYGNAQLYINEAWVFNIRRSDITLQISRTLSNPIVAEEVASPTFTFKNMDTWEGAYQDYGGLAWFYLFNKKRDTYGVHSSASDFWNSKTGNGLTIDIDASGKQVAMNYSRTIDDNLAVGVSISPDEIVPRFDAGTNRRRFVRDTTDVWSPILLRVGTTNQKITFSSFDFKEKYGRGHFAGVNEEQVSAVLNTIARIGVIDKQHFGGNSWHTPYGPICLHEQYIAQMGVAINDPAYLKGYSQTLDFYRDNAIKEDGRVWPRWAYTNEDAMPQQFTDKGFYEAQWGFLLDSNPDYVTNVAELYDQTGDLQWVKSHQLSSEKALDWIIKRDTNNNGLVEMVTDSHKEKRGSDWIDIIWASYENAFVNAKLYRALVLWADIERQLGDTTKEQYYKQFAEKLKTSFNKSIADGGFWDPEKKCYIHWRDKDGSIHGNNMVIPVNFMAIAYDICDDDTRTKTILDAIEVQMQKENLFFWPICLYSYALGEGNDWQFPFANYENGDIFLSWGSVGVKAYARYKPELALKYVKNVLAQYAKDGLAFQRYGRVKQDGLGDDILSGNSLSVVGLYQSIYGINPRYNRLYLDPHITPDLTGTRLRYAYQNKRLNIDLDVNKFSVSNNQFKISSKVDFGFFGTEKELLYFDGNKNSPSLKVTTAPNKDLTLDIEKWEADEISFTQVSKNVRQNLLTYQLNDLQPNSFYTILVNAKVQQRTKSNAEGTLTFDGKTTRNTDHIVILNQ
jgi:hypothetical protein